MASELRVDTLKDSAGANSVGMAYVAEGSAKAWMTANGDGSAVDDSLNTSSLTDGGTGTFTQNYTASFNNADYSWVGLAEFTFASNAIILNHVHSGKTTSATLFYTYNSYDGASTDTEENCTQVLGDLA